MEFDLSSAASTGIAADTDFVVIPSTYFPGGFVVDLFWGIVLLMKYFVVVILNKAIEGTTETLTQTRGIITMHSEVEGSFRLTATGSKKGGATLLSRHTTTSEAFPFQQSISSEWTVKNAGGAYKSSSQTFKRNPIFTLTVEEDDTDVCLTLRQHRKKQNSKKSAAKQRAIKWLKIGIYLFHSSAQLQSLTQSDKVCSSTFINLPEVSVFLPSATKLAAGTYLVVCATYEPNLQATFALTALSDKKCVLEAGRTESAQPAKVTASVASKQSKPRGKGKTTKSTGKRGRRKKSGASALTFHKAQQTSTMITDLYANF